MSAYEPVCHDFGLTRIASHFGKSEALEEYRRGVALEGEGAYELAMSHYQRAYRQWPALDSLPDGGLPRSVREEAAAASFSCEGMLASVSVREARASRVGHSPAFLDARDLAAIDAVCDRCSATSNAQNATHDRKVCTMLNDPPAYSLERLAPRVVDKLLRFAAETWASQDWSNGPLAAVADGPERLSIRLAEERVVRRRCDARARLSSIEVWPPRWRYSPGSGLFDPLHHDVDSVLTMVVLLSEPTDCRGGVFRTYESDDTHLEHPMAKGDAICFISHKYHNITEVTTGHRRSMVIELWQGGVGHLGRGD